MSKLLLFILVLVAIFFVRRWMQRDEAPAREPRSREGSQVAELPAEQMRECLQCGLLIPDSEAVRVGDAHFCCIDHAREHEAAKRS